jgi:nucleoside-diphosphate-sugar epimerase
MRSAGMKSLSVIVLGGTGLVGSAVSACLEQLGHDVLRLNSGNYAGYVGAAADVLINCNGNSYRFKANNDPRWDFDASVLSVEKSLFDFTAGRYLFVSTVDVYPETADSQFNHEDVPIDPRRLTPYAFHKWLAERLVERFAARPLILRLGTVIGPEMKKGPLFDIIKGQQLHMSLQSELSLIDTETIAQAVATFVSQPPEQTIINLTGTGVVRLEELCRLAGLEPALAPGAERIIHHYNLNNLRLRNTFPITSSLEMATRLLAGLKPVPAAPAKTKA